jgi:hypothetical protein
VVKKTTRNTKVSVRIVEPPSPHVPPVWRTLEATGRLLEHHHQAIFVSWFRKTFPDVRIFAIPNGGKRSKREAERLKLEGVSPGVPDLFIPQWRLWIEMKTAKGGRTSDEQESWVNYLGTVGYHAIVCHGHEVAISVVSAMVDDLILAI